MPFPVHTLSSSDESDDGGCDLVTRIQKKISVTNKKIRLDSQETNANLSTNIINFTPAPLDVNNDASSHEYGKENVSPCEYLSEDSLPPTENKYLFSGGSSSQSSHLSENSNPFSQNENISEKQKMKALKEAEKVKRRIEREEKKREKERLKEEKEKEKLAKKSVKPGECFKFVAVCLDRQIVESPSGSGIIGRMVEMEIEYRVFEQRVPYSVTFLRKDPITGEETSEEDALIIYSASDFIPLVQNQIYPDIGHSSIMLSLKDQCQEWKETLDSNRLTIVVCGLESFHREQDKLTQRNYRSKLLPNEKKGRGRKKTQESENSNFLNVSRIDVETALVTAQLSVGVNHRMCSEPASVAHYVAMVTKAIAERPFKQSLQSTAFSWHAESSCTNTVKIDKNGTGLLRLWHAQLRQISTVGLETAQAIASAYGSPSLLVKAYQQLPPKEAALLLSEIPIRRGQGVLANSRKLGPELSRKVYLLFTSKIPDKSLDDKNLLD